MKNLSKILVIRLTAIILTLICLVVPALIIMDLKSESIEARRNAEKSTEFFAIYTKPVIDLYQKGYIDKKRALSAITDTVVKEGSKGSINLILLDNSGNILASSSPENIVHAFHGDRTITHTKNAEMIQGGLVSFSEYDSLKKEYVVRDIYTSTIPELGIIAYAAVEQGVLSEHTIKQLTSAHITFAVILIIVLLIYMAEFFTLSGIIHNLVNLAEFSNISEYTDKFRIQTPLIKAFQTLISRLKSHAVYSTTLMNSIPNPVLLCDMRKTVIHSNPAAEKLFRSDTSLRGLSLSNLFSVKYMDRNVDEEFVNAEEEGSFYWEAICPDRLCPVLIQPRKIILENTEFRIIVATDISDMRQANSNISFMSLLLERVSDSIIAYRPGDKIFYANAPACVLHQYDEKEILSMNSEELIFATSLATYRENISRLKDIKNTAFNAWHRRKDGTFVLTETRCSMISIDNNNVIIETHHNLTEINTSQHALRESEERFKAFFSTAKDCVFIATSNGFILNINDSGTAILKIEKRDLSETDIFSFFVNGDDLKRFKKIISSSGFVRDFRTDFRIMDGTIIPVEISASYFHNPVYHITGYNGFIRDLSNEAAVEAQARQAQKLDAIGRLAGGIAHDFNNILTIIIGNTEMGLLTLGSDHELYESLLEIKESADRAAKLTRQLLTFGKKQIAQPELINPGKIIKDFHRILKRITGENIELELKIDPVTCSIKADKNHFEQIILNLIVNSRDAINEFKQAKEKKITIEMSQLYADSHLRNALKDNLKGAYVVISIIDSGIGISDENVEKVFDPFFTTKSSDGGAGMGLSTVFGIVAQNNAKIVLESHTPGNTRFDIYWPCASEKMVSSEEDDENTVEEYCGDEKILVVEDEASLCNFTSTALKKKGYTVMASMNSEDAYEIAKANPDIALAFIDIIIQGKNGILLAKEICKLNKNIKLIFTSGHPDNYALYKDACEQSADYIGKPYNISSLAKVIRKNLDAKKQQG